MRRVLFALACLLPAVAGAATLEPEVPALGQRALLRLEVAPTDSTEWPIGLNAAVRATADPEVFEFMPLRVGVVGAVLPATGDTLRVEVPTTLPEVRPEFLRPLQATGDIRPDWAPTLLLVAAILGLLGGLLYALIRRRRPQAAVAGPPPEPAEVVALRELARLENERLVEAGRFEEFYVRGSHILREYAGRRFDIPVLDYTTTETLDSMRDIQAAEPWADRIAPLLYAADEVKFARHEPGRDDGEYWLREARTFVESTTEEPEPEGAGPDDDVSGDRPAVEVST